MVRYSFTLNYLGFIEITNAFLIKATKLLAIPRITLPSSTNTLQIGRYTLSRQGMTRAKLVGCPLAQADVVFFLPPPLPDGTQRKTLMLLNEHVADLQRNPDQVEKSGGRIFCYRVAALNGQSIRQVPLEQSTHEDSLPCSNSRT